MSKEIERKFFVNYIPKLSPGTLIQQGYLVNANNVVLRVRVYGDEGFLTLKGETQGFSRDEFEFFIPSEYAETLLKSCNKVLTKIRYKIGPWELDKFLGKLDGLWIAEIELKSEDEQFEIPSWVGREITEDPQYYNSNLIERC